MAFDMDEAEKGGSQDEWQSCIVCGMGKDGFSMIYNDERGTVTSVWSEFCSYGCMLAMAKVDRVFL